MAKVKVRVLYPTAFAEMVAAGDETELDEALATSLVGEGFAELLEKRGPGRPKKDEASK